MIGRQEDVEQLVLQLSNGAHRIVAGPRRTGKSSVCEAAMGQLRVGGSYTVEVSLFKHTNAATLAEAIAEAALSNRGAMHRLIERVRGVGTAALRGAALTLAMKVQAELGDGVELALRPGLAAQDPERALRLALELPGRIAQRDGRPLVMFIDELQELATSRGAYGDPDALMKYMRETIYESSGVTSLFAGSMERMMRELFTSRRRAFYGFGGFHDLTPIAPQEWKTGLKSRFAEDNCTIDANALERIIELGDSHPRTVMLIAQQTHSAAIELDAQHIDMTLAQRGWRGAMEAERARHDDAVEAIRAMGAAAITVVARLASGISPYRDLDSQTASRMLKRLERAGIINRGGPRDWRFDDPLLVSYIREEIAA
jgi:AAA+ ATPase superfamily predicted ATPase